MRRVLILVLVLFLLLSGCSGKDQAKFYYSRAVFQYESQDSVIVSENRDISSHANDLSFLISLYLMGPLEKESVSLFPVGVKLLRTQKEGGILTIELSPITSISDSEYTLACTCMALTCMELTDSETVTIVSGNRSVTIDPGMLTLFDSGIPLETTEGGDS